MGHTFNPSALRQRQVALHECRVNLIYIVSSRSAGTTTQGDLVLKQNSIPPPPQKIKIQTAEDCLQNKIKWVGNFTQKAEFLASWSFHYGGPPGSSDQDCPLG